MGFSVSSMYTGIGSVTHRHKEGAVRRTQRTQKSDSGKNSKKNKKLNYNFKEVSARILRAKTSGSARQAVIMARSRIAMLRAKLNTGEYDTNEVESALIHAEQMERVAKKRLKHMQAEEEAKKSGNTVTVETEEEELDEAENDGTEKAAEELELSERELRELMRKMQELMEQYTEQTDDSGGLDELSEELLAGFEDMEPEELERRKKKHRSDELMEIVKADMQYLKSMFDRLEREKRSASSGVSLQLGGSEVSVSVPDVPLSTSVVQTPADVPVVTESVSVDVSV